MAAGPGPRKEAFLKQKEEGTDPAIWFVGRSKSVLTYLCASSASFDSDCRSWESAKSSPGPWRVPRLQR